MNFRFKLSKRLARLKATLAVSVVLALACQSDLTDPKPPYSSPRPSVFAADLTPLTPASVVASGNDGNLPQNTLDKSLATRWSAQGDGQWIRYDLGALVDMDRAAVAWYLGDTRIAYFDIEVSWDATLWWSVFSGQSSGQTLQPEIYSFRRTTARYVRIVGHGNSQSAWNSITEVAIVAPAPTVTSSTVPVAAVTVSPASTSVAVGATVQLAAVTRDSAGNTLTGRTVTWTISNSAVATIAESGLVTGVATGTVTITATSEGKSGTAAVSATAPGCLTSAGTWRNNSIPSRAGGFEAQFDATPTTANMNGVVGLANGPAADWTNLAAIVRFNSTGTIDARNGGDYAAATAIPYTAGTTYHFRLHVDLASHSYTTYVTPAGGTEQPLGNALAFRTEQSAVSALNNLGVYAAGGSATVCNVTLGAWTPPPPAPVATVTVSPAAPSVSVGATVQLTATLKDASGNVLAGRSVTWASSTLGMATVSTGGFVTGVAVGPVTITATSEGQSGRATVTVNPVAGNPVAGPTPLYTLGNGANYYGAPSGSDANPCTATAPCYTMARVSQLMSPGDNAHFAAGNYTWSYSGNKVTKSGTAAAPISYISDAKWGAKVYGSGCDPIWNSGDYVQIINFDVTGNCSDGIGVNGNYNKVIGNRVHDLPGTSGYAGILADCCSYNLVGIQIIGNVVDNIAMGTGSNLIHGIYAAGPSSVIMNNIVTRASAACITHYHGSTRSIVSNNIVANCKYGIQIAADGDITSDDYTTVDNNIAVNNGRGIYEYPTAGPHNVYNNNIVYNNSTANFDLCCGGTQSGTITLTAAQFSALFVNYTGDMTGDYHLRSGAVAIDAGTTQCAAGVTSCVPLLDFDGVSRPQGAAYDIGVYEYVSVPPPSDPVALWHFDEGSGQTGSDASGNNNTGTLGASGNPGWVGGRINSALQFDGVSSKVTVAPSSTINNLAAFTYATWIYPTGGGSSGKGRLFAKETSVGFDDVYFNVNIVDINNAY